MFIEGQLYFVKVMFNQIEDTETDDGNMMMMMIVLMLVVMMMMFNLKIIVLLMFCNCNNARYRIN